MDITELLRSAIRAIRTNKTRSALTALGIIIGVASVIMLVSIGSGLQAYVVKQFEQLGSNVIFVLPGKVNLGGSGGGNMRTQMTAGSTSKFTFEDVKNISRLGKAVETASSAVTKTGLAKYRNKTYDVTIVGVDENFQKVRSMDVTEGVFINKNMVDKTQGVAVVGPKVVENLMTKGEDPIGKEIEVSGRKVKIVGVTKAQGGGFGGGGDQDSMAILPVTTAAKLIGSKSPAAIYVLTTSADTMDQATAQVKKYFYQRKLTNDDFSVLEPTQILSTINSFLG